MIHVAVDGGPVGAAEGSTIMEVAKSVSIKAPSLCHMRNVHQCGSYHIYMVEVKGMRNLRTSCITKVREGMVIRTHPLKALEARKMLYELLFFNHPKGCLNYGRNTNCELQDLGYELGVAESRFEGAVTKPLVDISPPTTRDTSKCILYHYCMTVCKEIQKMGAIQAWNRGFDTMVSPAMSPPLNSTVCAMCGQCTVVYPVGVLEETDGLTSVWRVLIDPDKRVVAQVTPAVRTALGEEFGLPTGIPVAGKMTTALHEVGFDNVFDTLFSADLATLEGRTGLLGHLNTMLKGDNNKERPAALPTITSCSPGWIKHIERQLSRELGHLSTCKNSHITLEAVAKLFYAERTGTDPRDIFVVSVMPCTARKYEVQCPEMEVDGRRNVDVVSTTRELARIVKKTGLDFVNLPEDESGFLLGLGTGAADILGTAGDTTETTLYIVYEAVTGRKLPFEKPCVTSIVDLGQVKTASITIEKPLPIYGCLNGTTVNVTVTNGLEGASRLMEEAAVDTLPCHFIGVVGCPKGCINGEGQPRRTEGNYRERRPKALYNGDEREVLYKSHGNPDPMKLYNEYLGESNGHLSHHLLHTYYVERGKYNRPVKRTEDIEQRIK